MANDETPFIRRVQDWGMIAGLAVSILTILFMLLPIYRKQVQMEDKLQAVVDAQQEFNNKYVPLIQNSVTNNAVLNTKVDALSQTLQEISRKLDERHSFR